MRKEIHEEDSQQRVQYHGSTSNHNSLALQPLHFRAQDESSKLKRKDFCVQISIFSKALLFHVTGHVSMYPTTCVLCVLLHVSSHHGGACCHFTFGVTLHRSQTRHRAMAQDACGLQVVPLPLFPLPYCFSCTFSSFAVISLVLPLFVGVLALPSSCCSQGFVHFRQG